VRQTTKLEGLRTVAAENQDLGIAPAVGSAGGVGALLREARMRRGQDLAVVAGALRIRQPYLQAIEEGRFEDLPGSTYAVGFVRGYAEYLGLDSKEIIRRFRQENGELSSRAELVFPSAVTEGSIPTGALLGFAVLAAAAAYGAWYWYQSRESSIAEVVPALPERLAALIRKPVGNGSEVVPVSPVDSGKPTEVTQQSPAAAPPIVPPTQSPTASPASPPTVSPALAPTGTGHEDIVPPSEEDAGSAVPTPAQGASSSSAAKTPAPPSDAAGPSATESKPAKEAKGKDAKGKEIRSGAAKGVAAAAGKVNETGSVPPVGTPPDKVLADKSAKAAAEVRPPESASRELAAATPATGGGGTSRVVLRAAEDCWIEIRDTKGQVVQSRLLRKGQTYSVPERPGLTLTAGSAGALAIMVDGRPSEALGKIGMVRRDVPLDADRLKNEAQEPTPSGNPPASPTE
jgi:cytoskeleton protein RodZ